MANMNNKNKIYEVQIKSKALIQEGKKSLIPILKVAPTNKSSPTRARFIHNTLKLKINLILILLRFLYASIKKG